MIRLEKNYQIMNTVLKNIQNFIQIIVSVLLKIVNKVENKNFVLKKNVYNDGLISNLSKGRLLLLIIEFKIIWKK